MSQRQITRIFTRAQVGEDIIPEDIDESEIVS